MPSCCVLKCRARKNINQPTLTLHRFPANEILKQKWIQVIGIENIKRQKTCYVCSMHFDETSFNKTLGVVRLRDGAVPLSSLVEPLSAPCRSKIPHLASHFDYKLGEAPNVEDARFSVHDESYSVRNSPATKTEAEKPFSWQQQEVAVVPCDDKECDTEVLDEEIFSEEPHPASSDDKSSQQWPEEEHGGESSTFVCNICCSDIIGFRYSCVQCLDYDLCGACEARRAHRAHYVLRIPEGKPPGEVSCKLQTIRRALLGDAGERAQAGPGQPLEIKEEEDDSIDAEPPGPTLLSQSDCDKNPTADLADPLDTASPVWCDVTDVDSDSTTVYQSQQPHSGDSSDDECAQRGPSARPSTARLSYTQPSTNMPSTADSKIFPSRSATHQLQSHNTQTVSLTVDKVESNTYAKENKCQPVRKRVIDIKCLPEAVRKKLRIVRQPSLNTEQSMEKDPSIPAQSQSTKEDATRR